MTNIHTVARLAPVIAVLLAGCASYERRPLELEGYAAAWPGRDIDVESVSAFAAALSAGAEPCERYDPSDGLSLTEAEAVALVFNPQLRLARARAEVPLASARQAGWWPDPQFEAEVLRFVNRGSPSRFRFDGPSFDGVNTGILGPNGLSPDGLELTPPGYRRDEGDFIEDPWIVGASLSITIPISGRLAVEQDWSWAEYRAAWRRILIREWELLINLRAAWLAWSTTHARVAVTTDYVAQLGAVATTANRLATAGELKPTDARLLAIELQRQRTLLQALAAEQEQQRLELFALLGVAPEAPVRLLPAVFVPQVQVPPAERRERLLARDPRLLAVHAAYEAAEQRLRLEVREQYPDLNIGPSYSFEESFSRLGFGFGFPIPLWNHNRQAVAEAAAEREAARVQAQAQVEEVFSELARAETRLRYAAERRQMLLTDVVPLVDRQVDDLRRMLELGEAEVLVLRDALGSAVETKLEVLTATLAEAQAADVLQQMLAPRWITPSQAETEETDQ